ncbi:MAG TPA: hypothetical protein VFA25_05095 [Actinomycetota bacterium]|nr:hypothetical protein [Actinomycetota bacterium]
MDLARRVVRRVEAFRAGAVFRLRVAAAFRPAATRFGLFLDEVRFRVLAAFRAVDLRVAVLRVRVLAAFRAAVFRLRVAAAFRPAAARFGDFRADVRLRPADGFRAVDFRAVDFRAGDFRAGDFLDVVLFLEAAFRAGAVLRLRVAAAFRPAAARFGDFRDVVFLAVGFRPVVVLRLEVARFAVLLAAVFFRVVAFLVAFRVVWRAVRDLVAATRSPSSDIPGAGVGIGVAVRSGAIMPPCSGALGRSTVSRSQPGLGGRYGSGIASSCSDVPVSCPDVVSVSSSSFHGQVRSDIGMQPPPLCGSGFPYPADAEKMRGNDA